MEDWEPIYDIIFNRKKSHKGWKNVDRWKEIHRIIEKVKSQQGLKKTFETYNGYQRKFVYEHCGNLSTHTIIDYTKPHIYCTYYREEEFGEAIHEFTNTPFSSITLHHKKIKTKTKEIIGSKILVYPYNETCGDYSINLHNYKTNIRQRILLYKLNIFPNELLIHIFNYL